jgi:hypothetical protein
MSVIIGQFIIMPPAAFGVVSGFGVVSVCADAVRGKANMAEKRHALMSVFIVFSFAAILFSWWLDM